MFRFTPRQFPATPTEGDCQEATTAHAGAVPVAPTPAAAGGGRSSTLRRLARRGIDRLLLPACHRAGVLHLTRRCLDRRALTVVMFHRVLPLDSDECRHAEREYVVGTDEFDRCLGFFGRHYTVVSLLAVERAAQGLEKLPPHPLLITFDDGWRDNLVHAEPILRRHRMKATLFVNVDAVRDPGLRWWQDALVEAVGRHAPSDAATGWLADLYGAIRALLPLSPAERWAKLAPLMRWTPSSRQMLTVPELAALDPTVWDVGSHGLSHAPLTVAGDPERELVESARWLVATCKAPVRSVSLPHGRHSPAIAALAQATYPLVFSSEPVLARADGGLRGLIGRLHLPSAACASDETLARFLWIRRRT